MDIGHYCFHNSSPNFENIEPSTPEPQNINIGQSFDNNESIERLKKTLPEQNYFSKILQNFTKVMFVEQGFFWTFNSSVAIKWLSYIYILRFGGGRIKVFKFGAVIEKIVGTYVHFGTFSTG